MKNLVIITDVHSDIERCQKILDLYPIEDIICLGDIVNLLDKNLTFKNQNIVDFFIKNKIFSLRGNHDDYVASNAATYGINSEQAAYLKSLPLSKKINIGGQTYSFYHYKPNDFWGMENMENINYNGFCIVYGRGGIDGGVVIGHTHKEFVKTFKESGRKLFGIGALRDGNYAVLNENGVEYKRI